MLCYSANSIMLTLNRAFTKWQLTNMYGVIYRNYGKPAYIAFHQTCLDGGSVPFATRLKLYCYSYNIKDFFNKKYICLHYTIVFRVLM